MNYCVSKLHMQTIYITVHNLNTLFMKWSLLLFCSFCPHSWQWTGWFLFFICDMGVKLMEVAHLHPGGEVSTERTACRRERLYNSVGHTLYLKKWNWLISLCEEWEIRCLKRRKGYFVAKDCFLLLHFLLVGGVKWGSEGWVRDS